jgi:hypothetical protein
LRVGKADPRSRRHSRGTGPDEKFATVEQCDRSSSGARHIRTSTKNENSTNNRRDDRPFHIAFNLAAPAGAARMGLRLRYVPVRAKRASGLLCQWRCTQVRG